jgi:hypothetical protein
MYRYIRCLTITALLYLITDISVSAEERFRTEIFREDIKSLEIKVEGEIISNPYIELNSNKKIEIGFDALHRTSGRFAYTVVHCNADWKQSALLPIEYMKGFQNTAIEDFANSINTTVHYTNYKLTFPNIDVRLTASGNYAIKIYEEDTPDNIVLTACFSVVEPKVDILEAFVTGNTDIDFNKSHQQVSFAVDYKNLNSTFPQNELKVFVYQNNNTDDTRSNLQPVRYSANKMIFEHDRNLIFNAGNEYRRIEFLTNRYNGMGVENVGYFRPYYNVTLFEDQKRAGKSYLYDQDQDGRFFTNCSRCEDPDTEADYYIVHFSLVSEYLESGDVFLYGDVFTNILNDFSRMEYNAENERYEKAVMLKQGLYNYQYVFVDNETNTALPGKIEGDFFETENEYTISVYYNPPGARYDRLVGVKTIRSNYGTMSARPLSFIKPNNKIDSKVTFK